MTYIPISFIVIYGRISYSPFTVSQKASQKTELRNNKNAKLINLEMTLESNSFTVIFRFEIKKNHKSNNVRFRLKYHKSIIILFYRHDIAGKLLNWC